MSPRTETTVPTADAGPVVPTLLDDALTAAHPAELHTRGRHAWRLSELIGDAYWEAKQEVHVHTADGQDFVVRGSGRTGEDVILVERDDGTRYVGWLNPDAEQYGEELADAERPSERLENVVSVTVSAPPTRPELPPATIEIVIDGETRVLRPGDLAAMASRSMPSRNGGAPVPVVDLTRDLGGDTTLVSITADGAQVAATPPSQGAIPVLYANRRARFKLSWLSPAGIEIEGAKFREVSRIELHRR